MTTYAYTVPDGSGDHPDKDGRHTANVNVMHSAENYARFPGCPSCKSIAQSSCPSCYHVPGSSVFGSYDPVTDAFASVVHHSPRGCGDPDCSLCAMYAAGWCQNCEDFTRPPRSP